MPQPDFFAFLAESLEAIRMEEPEAHLALTRSIDRLRARLVSDGTVAVLRFESRDWRIELGAFDADIEVGFDREVTLDLIAGRLTLEDAIMSERLRIFGAADKINVFYDALLIYIEGMIRAPRSGALLKRYCRQ
jgi:hypothetical protein